jgi:hypothetical protein
MSVDDTIFNVCVLFGFGIPLNISFKSPNIFFHLGAPGFSVLGSRSFGTYIVYIFFVVERIGGTGDDTYDVGDVGGNGDGIYVDDVGDVGGNGDGIYVDDIDAVDGNGDGIYVDDIDAVGGNGDGIYVDDIDAIGGNGDGIYVDDIDAVGGNGDGIYVDDIDAVGGDNNCEYNDIGAFATDDSFGIALIDGTCIVCVTWGARGLCFGDLYVFLCDCNNELL